MIRRVRSGTSSDRKNGLRRFVELLEAYVGDVKNERISEHEHYGPYGYLKLMTCEKAEITEDAICGTLSDFKKLSAIVREKLDSSLVGRKFTVGDEYGRGSQSVIKFEIRDEGFDPANADPLLSHAS